MSEDIARLEAVYREIAALTQPRCLAACVEPGACCTPAYCDLAEARAREFGVQLPRQQHPRLKFMAPGGCVVPPLLRPLCAVHVCEAQLLDDPDYAAQYFRLRKRVCGLEERLGPSWPQGMARDYWE